MTLRRFGASSLFVGLVALLSGCGFIPASEREWRLDPDGDGAEWPLDCDSLDPTVLTGPPWFYDKDGDQYGGTEVMYECESPGPGWMPTGEDCDDEDPYTYPHAPELCDGLDQNCEGTIDEGFPLLPVYADTDYDGWGADQVAELCGPVDGTTLNPGDCDDTRPEAWPAAPEQCNNLDDDCDELIDEAIVWTYWYDGDRDTYGDPDTMIQTCAPEAGYVFRGDDCDDTDDATYPYAYEFCGDDRDNDCNGIVNDEYPRYTDVDRDGFGDPATERLSCDRADNEVDNGTDCNDADPYVNIAVFDVCGDGIDNDCANGVDDACEG